MCVCLLQREQLALSFLQLEALQNQTEFRVTLIRFKLQRPALRLTLVLTYDSVAVRLDCCSSTRRSACRRLKVVKRLKRKAYRHY